MTLQSDGPTINTYHKSSPFTSINQPHSTPISSPNKMSTFQQSSYSNRPFSNNDSTLERPQAEIVDGPSFSDAMKRFQSSSNAKDDSYDSNFYESKENVLKSSSYKTESSYKMTTTSRSYRLEESWNDWKVLVHTLQSLSLLWILLIFNYKFVIKCW